MGIFNYVNLKIPCPYCGEVLSGFQTKDGVACMDTVEPWTVNRFYTNCPGCDHWVEYVRKDNQPIDLIEEYKQAIEILTQFVDIKKLPEFKVNELISSAKELVVKVSCDEWMKMYVLKD
jgi:hypothetical protein